MIEQPIRRWRPARVPLLPLAAATVATAAAATMLVVPVATGPGLREVGLPPGVSAVAAVSPSPPGRAGPGRTPAAGSQPAVHRFGVR
ncbi:hypothetical protein BZL30_4300 [Mycobacterium kansasii]|uniref:Uncharacterized protein n=1 Tax=Mycobacterium kansasii TaxID=1768 RepID=A0A1V3XB82_MYCKA|nr:hypothetical protein BZL30_4300 [Mycobacterium kansasii]